MSDDAAWIAARKAASLASREMDAWVRTALYEQLPPELLALRRRFDEAQRHVQAIQRTRSLATR